MPYYFASFSCLSDGAVNFGAQEGEGAAICGDGGGNEPELGRICSSTLWVPVSISLTEGLSEFAQVKLQESEKMGKALGNRHITNMDFR